MPESGSADQRRGESSRGIGVVPGRGDRLALATIAGVWLLSLLLWVHPGLTIPDGAGYFVYLPSTWIDHDLLFFNEWQRLGLIRDGIPVFKSATATNHLGNHWTVGPALAWYPAFVAADIAARAVPALHRFPLDGIVLPYNMAVIVTSSVAGLATLLIGYRLARRYCTPAACASAAIAIWLGTPLLWYSVRDAAMSHAMSSFACALVVLLSLRLRKNVSGEAVLAVGVALGFAAMVRIQNAAFIVVPFLVLDADGRRILLRKPLPLIAGGLLGVLPELLVSTVLYGQPLGFASIGVRAIGWHPWSRFWIIETLFSWYHGLFSWTPVAAIGVAGFIALARRDPPLATAAIVSFFIQWIANSSADRAFWAAISFGSRRFDNMAVFFLLGVAALMQWKPRLVAVLVALSCLWTMLLFFASRHLDLNAYQTFVELTGAIRVSDIRFGFLSNVPRNARAVALGVLVLALLVNAAIAALLFFIPARMRTSLAALYLAAMTGFLAWTGANGAARTARYADLIARSRAFSAVADHEVGEQNLLENELLYLRKSGRLEEAADTERELQAMLRNRAAALAAARAAQ
jgi:hypothetical protein